jgi:hypothetical protein
MSDSVPFFSVSGLRGTGRTRLYHQLKSVLPGRFPEQTFAFIGSPFSSLPLPLMWEDPERDKHATTRLFECWSRLNHFSINRLRPQLERGRCVVSDGFGLDALLYATACCDCPVENHEAEDVHYMLVGVRLKAQKLPPPEYLLVQAPHSKVEGWILLSNPDLRDLTNELERERFIRHEEHTIERYFRPENGQNTPFILDAAAHDMDALCEMAVAHIGRRLEKIAQAA